MPNRPLLIVEIEVVHRPDIAVGRVNRVAVEIPDVPKHRRLPLPPYPLGVGARSFEFLARLAPESVFGSAGSPIVSPIDGRSPPCRPGPPIPVHMTPCASRLRIPRRLLVECGLAPCRAEIV